MNSRFSLITGGSVWWTWTASESTTAIIAIVRDNPSVNSTGTSFWVYSGTNLTALTLIDANSFDNPSGRYSSPATVVGNPTCSFQSRGHVITDP